MTIATNITLENPNHKKNYYFLALFNQFSLAEPYVEGLNHLYTEYDHNFEKEMQAKYIFTFKIVKKIEKDNVIKEVIKQQLKNIGQDFRFDN